MLSFPNSHVQLCRGNLRDALRMPSLDIWGLSNKEYKIRYLLKPTRVDLKGQIYIFILRINMYFDFLENFQSSHDKIIQFYRILKVLMFYTKLRDPSFVGLKMQIKVKSIEKIKCFKMLLIS